MTTAGPQLRPPDDAGPRPGPTAGSGPLPGPALGPTDGRPSWRERAISQQPGWPDQAQADVVARELARQPPLVFAGECDSLKERLAAVTRGEAFVLQGGDCAETFAGATADAVRGKLHRARKAFAALFAKSE